MPTQNYEDLEGTDIQNAGVPDPYYEEMCDSEYDEVMDEGLRVVGSLGGLDDVEDETEPVWVGRRQVLEPVHGKGDSDGKGDQAIDPDASWSVDWDPSE